MNTLIADSGSTKTEWWLHSSADGSAQRFFTPGINPCLMSDETIVEVLHALPSSILPATQGARIHFYGAGCRPDQTERMSHLLTAHFGAADAVVGSDLMGAALALCGHSPGIVAILGTGSGSALYDGHSFVNSIPSLGFILGDEGSGAVMGRHFVSGIFKKQWSKALTDAFFEEHELSVDELIRRVYREQNANRFLASFAPFLAAHRDEDEVQRFLVNEFLRFFERNILPLERPELKVNFVGSIAHHFRAELLMAAEACGCTVGRILSSPAEELLLQIVGDGAPSAE